MRVDPICFKHTGIFIDRFAKQSMTYQWGKVSQSFNVSTLPEYLESLDQEQRELIAKKIDMDEKSNRPFIEQLILPTIKNGKLPEDEEVLNKLKSLRDEQGSDLFTFTVNGGANRDHEPFQSIPVDPVFDYIDPEASKRKEKVSLAIEARDGHIGFERSSFPEKVKKATLELSSGELYKIVDANGQVKLVSLV